MDAYSVVALDIGHSAVKMTFDKKDGVGRAIFPSLACPAIPIANIVEAERSKKETVQVRGREYFVGDTARIQAQAELATGLSEAWIESPEHAALVEMAKRIVENEGVTERRLWILGLPVGQYNRDREKLANILTEQLPSTDRVKIMQQPDAVYFMHVYNRNGLPQKGVDPDSEAWGIIDVGYYTTDFVLYEQGRYVESATGRYQGVREIAERVQRDLAQEGITRTVIDVERALISKTLMHRGTRLDLSESIHQAVSQMFAKIVDETHRLMGRRIDALNGIMVAGGSAELLVAEMQKQWPHALVVQDEYHDDSDTGVRLHGPRFVVSEGYYRYGKSALVLEQYSKTKPLAVAA